jgi:exonuclease SbcD
MKLLHTSDWHLGRLFHNVSLLEDQAHALEQLVAYAVDHQVAAVLVAGDIYDRAVPPADAIALLDDTLHKLTYDHKIPVILISGNHDSPERLAFGARQLANQKLHILHDLKTSNQPVIISDAAGKTTAAIYGIPYHTPEHVRSEFNEPVKTFDDAHHFLISRVLQTELSKTVNFKILLSHCFVDGAESCDSERPLAIGGADRVSINSMKDFDYVALGHLHGQQKRGSDVIRYCGSLLKYSFSEVNHHKSISLITLTPGQSVTIDHLSIIPLRELRSLTGQLDQLLIDGKKDPQKNDYLAITLTDQHAILDAMAKLRAVYPNVLQLEKLFLQQTSSSLAHTNRVALQNNELKMFGDFYRELSATPLTEQQQNYLEAVLTEIHNAAAKVENNS